MGCRVGSGARTIACQTASQLCRSNPSVEVLSFFSPGGCSRSGKGLRVVVLAAHDWGTNAELIADVAELWLGRGVKTLDPTYGKGTWWKKWRPVNLVTHDIVIDGVDFRDVPHNDWEFGQVAFDPPYVSIGGRKTSGMKEMHERYGMDLTSKNPAELQFFINAGMKECIRVLRPGGVLVMKCQDYVSSGKLFPGTFHTLEHAINKCGLELVDRFEHIGTPRPQPRRRQQVHARRNLSTLFVFRKGK